MGLHCGEDCVILTSTVFDWSTHVTDRGTDRRTGVSKERAIAYMLSRAKNGCYQKHFPGYKLIKMCLRSMHQNCWGSLQCSPRLLINWVGNTAPIPHPFDTRLSILGAFIASTCINSTCALAVIVKSQCLRLQAQHIKTSKNEKVSTELKTVTHTDSLRNNAYRFRDESKPATPSPSPGIRPSSTTSLTILARQLSSSSKFFLPNEKFSTTYIQYAYISEAT